MSRLHSCVVVFAKSPRLGAVKTRLIPRLSRHEALEVHRVCLLGTLRVVLSLPQHIAKAIYWSGSGAMALPPSWRRKLQIRRQRGADLGARMSHAMAEWLAAGWGRVVIVGGDHPTLPRARLLDAFRKLERAEVVLGPSLDGGYYLVGCRRWIPALFEKIPWGTARVLRVTRSRLARLGIPTAVLRPWYDVDRAGDLVRLRRELARPPRDNNDPRELRDFLNRLEGRIRQSSRRPRRDRQNKRRQPGRA